MDGTEFVTEVRKLHLEPGDTIIISVSEAISVRAYQHIMELCKRLFPDNRTIILAPGCELSTVLRVERLSHHETGG